MKVTRWIACLAGLLVSQWAVADGRAGTWETRLGVAFTNSTDADFAGGTTVDIDSDENLRLGLAYHLTDNIELGGMFNFGQTGYKADIAGDQPGEFFHVKGDLDFTTLMFDATWNMMSGPFSPFIVGARYDFNSAFAVHASYRMTWIDFHQADSPPDMDGFEISIGWKF